MRKKFEHYHLSLVERAQGDLLTPPVSREHWLRNAFAEGFQFRHQAKTFYWVPHPNAEGVILGTVQRQKQRVQHRPPEDGAAEFLAEEWQGSLVVIDPIYQPDGQKVAFEIDPSVGKTNAILSSIVSHLNERDGQYSLVAKALFAGESFWRFAERHGERLQYITFSFVVPNMFFGVSTDVDTGLRRIGEDTGAQEVKVTLDSDDGVDTKSRSVRDAMNYAEEGGASVTAKSLGGEYYSSTKKQKTSTIDGILSSGKADVQSWINKVLGRVKNNSLDEPDSASDDPDRG